MTVLELIEKLQNIEDKSNKQVVINGINDVELADFIDEGMDEKFGNIVWIW